MSDQPTSPAVPERHPSVGAVVFLFGDLFAARVPAGKRGTRAFASDAVVVTDALVQMMIAVGLVHLKALGSVTIERYRRERLPAVTLKAIRSELGLTVEGVLVTPKGEVPAHARSDRLTRELERLHEGCDVRSLVERLAPPSVLRDLTQTEQRDPYDAILKWAIDEAVELGLLRRRYTFGAKRRRGRITRFGAKWRLEPDASRIAALRPSAEALAAEWIAFRNDDPSLAADLRRQIAEGIEKAIEAGEPED
jgi:hypothetical protein